MRSAPGQLLTDVLQGRPVHCVRFVETVPRKTSFRNTVSLCYQEGGAATPINFDF